MIKVVNKNKEEYDIYIGRPSIYGNPFIIGKHGSREDVIEMFELYARRNEKLLNALYLLKDNRLGCFCKPLACHGDILVKLYNEKCGVSEFSLDEQTHNYYVAYSPDNFIGWELLGWEQYKEGVKRVYITRQMSMLTVFSKDRHVEWFIQSKR